MKWPNYRARRLFIRLLLSIPLAFVLMLSGTTLYQREALRQDYLHFPAPGKLIDVGGYRLHIYCAGARVEGSPTVVLEGGLGGPSVVWGLIQPKVAQHRRVCSYDRAGYGWSEAGPTPRTAQQIVKELHQLLHGAGEKPPYLLVGHSFGAVIVRLYASQYPADVVGLVFVDARHEDFFKRLPPSFLQIDQTNRERAELLAKITPLGFTRLIGNAGLLDGSLHYLDPLSDHARAMTRAVMIYNPSHWNTAVAERDVIEQSYDEVRGVTLPATMPLMVLSAEHGADAWRVNGQPLEQSTLNTWMELQQELSHLTQCNQWIIVPNSGHYIHLDQPDAVVDAIDSMLKVSPSNC